MNYRMGNIFLNLISWILRFPACLVPIYTTVMAVSSKDRIISCVDGVMCIEIHNIITSCSVGNLYTDLKFIGSHNLESEEICVHMVGEWEPGDAMCENIEIAIEVAGEWDDKRKAAFLKVAETCPVHHTMANCGDVQMTVV